MISVCIATHNGEKYIREQLVSILNQLGPDDEIVVSDDGSSDGTINEIMHLNDRRINVLRYEQQCKSKHLHNYVCRNFENALSHANGDIVFLSDQDDKWMPNKIKICVKELQNCDLVIHNIQIADGVLHPLDRKIFEDGFHIGNYLMMNNTYYGCAMAFNRRILEISLPFPNKLLVHDIWIGLLAETTGRVNYIDQPLILYRYHEDSISHAVNNNIWFKVGYRAYTLWCLFLRVIKLKMTKYH